MQGPSNELVTRLSRLPARAKEIVEAFSELRRLLEWRFERQQLRSLNLFCDWVVQGRLDAEPARDFLLLLDDRLGAHDPAAESTAGLDVALDPVTFSLLRDELEGFCERLGLPTTWTYDDAAWDQVVELLAGALRKSPLKLNRNTCGFTRLREAVLSIWKPDESIVGKQPGPVFGFRWDCTLDDGCTFTLSRVELPAGDEDSSP